VSFESVYDGPLVCRSTLVWLVQSSCRGLRRRRNNCCFFFQARANADANSAALAFAYTITHGSFGFDFLVG
jgi:hypothetical protein